MASLNTGLNTALSGLSASQTALAVTAHNISNAATTGYTRQQVNLQSLNVNTGEYQWKPVTAYVGTGVDSSKVTQARDSFLDVGYRAVNSQYSDYQQRTDDLSQVEDIFNEVSASGDDNLAGLSGQLNALVNDIGSSQSPTAASSMAGNIQNDVSNLTTKIRTDYNSLLNVQSREQNNLSIVVNGGTNSTNGGVNDILSSISTLNKQIVSMEVGGQPANDLRDKRNTLLDTLSGELDISAVEQSDGSVTVQLDSDVGTAANAMLVDSNNVVHKITVDTNGPADSTGLATTVVTWDGSDINNQNSTYAASVTTGGTTTWTGKTLTVGGGSVNGYLAILNGNGSGTGDYGDVGVNYLKNRLNDFARSFADIMNTAASDTSVNAGAGGATLIDTPWTGDSSKDPAATIDLSSAWKANNTLFYDNYNSSAAGSSIGGYAQAFTNALSGDQVSVYNSGTLYASGSLTKYAATFSNDVASVVSHNTTQAGTFETQKDDLDKQRQAVSSVSIDEETVNLMKYQQMYGASARVITTINDMMNTLLTMAQ
ncbi:flagellar hook-associated protein FlgK [Ethanoligenens sp.]|uniref:flagellar hook-associated protein FlgK n=1 Tax=Ethanoligenens sp. TaxID=2099655 RepID=UPI0039E7731C